MFAGQKLTQIYYVYYVETAMNEKKGHATKLFQEVRDKGLDEPPCFTSRL